MRSSRKFQIPFLHRFSLRANLVLLLAVVAAVVAADRVREIIQERSARISSARDEIVALAQEGVRRQTDLINEVHSMLSLATSLPETDGKSLTGCQVPFRRAIRDRPWINTMMVIHPKGRAVCTSDVQVSAQSFSDRDYFKDVLASRSFVLSDYIISRLSGKSVIVAVMPRLQNGRVASVLTASIDLNWLSRLAAETLGRSGAEMLLVDAAGTVIAAYPNTEAWLGNTLASRPKFWQALKGPDGVMESALLDGEPRLISHVHLPGTGAVLTVMRKRDDVLAPANSSAIEAVLKILMVGSICLFAVWWGGEQLVLRPIDALTQGAARIGAGDLDARVVANGFSPELRALAESFNSMATRLAEHDEELKRANNLLSELASTDGLTGLANRRKFDQAIEGEWRRACRTGESIGLLVLDVDHFKKYNDRYGHGAGDDCLRQIAGVLEFVGRRPGDLAARTGGEEFAVLLPGAVLDDAFAFAETARTQVAALGIAHKDNPVGLVTASIGVAAFVPRAGEKARMLLEAADSALYRAKHSGRNKVLASRCEVSLAS